MATILTSNTQGFNAVNFNFGASIIHSDEKMVILSIDADLLDKVEPSFFGFQKKN